MQKLAGAEGDNWSESCDYRCYRAKNSQWQFRTMQSLTHSYSTAIHRGNVILPGLARISLFCPSLLSSYTPSRVSVLRCSLPVQTFTLLHRRKQTRRRLLCFPPINPPPSPLILPLLLYLFPTPSAFSARSCLTSNV